MANFCRYCGKQINGTACDCPQAIAAVEKTRETKTTAQEKQENVSAPKQQSGGLKELILGFWKSPAVTLQKALETGNKVPQYLAAALFMVVLLVVTYVLGKNGKAALIITVCCVGLRAVYALGAYGMSKKAKPGLTLSDTMGVFSVTFFMDTVLVLLLFISIKIELYELMIALLLLWLLSAAISSLIGTWIISGRNMDLSYKITVILLAVISIIFIFVMRKVVADMAMNLFNSLMNDYSDSLGILEYFM